VFTDQLKKLFNILGNNNVRIVGGAVRNHIMGMPINDIDLATTHSPQVVINKLSANNIKVIPTGIKYGTVTAVMDKPYEITTLRIDDKCDGRHAKVTYTDNWQQDAERRDFTINSMYMDIEGNIYDYLNGKQDCLNGRVVFIGKANKRIEEDALRILRFFRFYAYYGKQLDKQSLQACIDNKQLIKKLSIERVSDEFIKILLSPNHIEVLKLLQQHKILPYEYDFNYLNKLKSNNLFARFFAINGNKVQIARQLKLSNKQIKTIQLLQDHLDTEPNKKLLRKLNTDNFKLLVQIQYALGQSVDVVALIKLADSWDIPQFPITGADLIKQGYKPGKQLGDKLKELEQKWEDNNYQF